MPLKYFNTAKQSLFLSTIEINVPIIIIIINTYLEKAIQQLRDFKTETNMSKNAALASKSIIVNIK